MHRPLLGVLGLRGHHRELGCVPLEGNDEVGAGPGKRSSRPSREVASSLPYMHISYKCHMLLMLCMLQLQSFKKSKKIIIWEGVIDKDLHRFFQKTKKNLSLNMPPTSTTAYPLFI